MIHFENVGKRYPAGREALSGVNFRLEKGEMAFLTGPSGAGVGTPRPPGPIRPDYSRAG